VKSIILIVNLGDGHGDVIVVIRGLDFKGRSVHNVLHSEVIHSGSGRSEVSSCVVHADLAGVAVEPEVMRQSVLYVLTLCACGPA